MEEVFLMEFPDCCMYVGNIVLNKFIDRYTNLIILPRKYDEIAKGNPFFAQVWYPFHDKNENNVYDESIFKDFHEK